MSAEWIRDLQESNSRNHKKLVIEKALIAYRLGSTNAEVFLYNCWLCYNPNYNYGVKTIFTTNGLTFMPNPWTRFWGLLESLRYGLDYRRSVIAIENMSKQFDSVEWNNVCSGVLINDLRCGINVKTLNSVLGNTEWRIPDLGE